MSKSVVWVEIEDPASGDVFYANPETGECLWDRTEDMNVLENDPQGVWWELFDETHQRTLVKLPYYYNTKTRETDWVPPEVGTLVNLKNIQRHAIGKRVSVIQARLSFDQNGQQQMLNGTGKRSSAPMDIPNAVKSPTSMLSTSAPMLIHDMTDASVDPEKVLYRSASVAEIAKTGGVSMPVNNPTAAVAMNPFNRPNRAHTDPHRNMRPAQNELRMHLNQLSIDNFARKFFATHTRGLFRRRVPIEKMLQWSKESLRLPLMVINKNLHKEALKCFKVIQRIMGDKPGGRNYKQMDDIQWLLEKGIFCAEMRDEIYVQVCKQLTNNPECTSVTKGWSIMCCLVCSFPPSRNFEEYLKNFIAERMEDRKCNVAPYAVFCRKKLERICKAGPRGKTPLAAEIERMIDGPFSPTLFGETLDEIMRVQAREYPNLQVPRILPFLASAVISLQGCATEGIFRVPGDADQITELRLRIEKNRYDLKGIVDPNVPAGLLKYWLRDLADPLIPTEFYERCITCADRVDTALQLVEELPTHNRLVAQYMIRFLQIVGDPANTPKTKMTVANIAMVFAPNFLRCPSDNPAQIFENTKHEQTFLRTLIQHSREENFAADQGTSTGSGGILRSLASSVLASASAGLFGRGAAKSSDANGSGARVAVDGASGTSSISSYAHSLSSDTYDVANDVLTHHVQRIQLSLQQALRYPLTVSYTRRHYYAHLMEVASSYEQWSSAALALDELDGNTAWKLDPRSDLYDYKLIRERLRSLSEARERGDISALTFLLRTSLSRNLGEMGNPSLYAHCHIGTKRLIEMYNDQVVKCLELICDTDFEAETDWENGSSDNDEEDGEEDDNDDYDNGNEDGEKQRPDDHERATAHNWASTGSLSPRSTGAHSSGSKKRQPDYPTNTWTAAAPYTDWLENAQNVAQATAAKMEKQQKTAGAKSAKRPAPKVRQSGFDERQKMEFFLNTRQAFGRTALLLSGGATLSLHHIGVIKCLWEAKLLPRIISGASGGSIIASFVCTHTEDEFERMLNPAYTKLNIFETTTEKGLFHHINRFFSNGVLFDVDALIGTLRGMFGDITFQEAYNRTRRILNIAVSSSTVYEMPRLLNYLTAPNVYIWSAVAASCAVPFVYRAAPLMAKDKMGRPAPWNPSGHRWIDGSVEGDLPMQKLSELFNVNHFIVCQVNPHVVPFLHKGLVKSWVRRTCENALSFSRSELNLRCNQLKELGLLPELLYRVQSIVSQKYVGDITIIPDIEVGDYLNILTNPSAETMLMATLKGEQATWPKISIAQNHLQIEMALDRMLYKCRMRSLLNPQKTLRCLMKRFQTAAAPELRHGPLNHARTSTGPKPSDVHKLRQLLIPSGWNSSALANRDKLGSATTADEQDGDIDYGRWPLTARSADGNYPAEDTDDHRQHAVSWGRAGPTSPRRRPSIGPVSKSVLNLPSFVQDWYHQQAYNGEDTGTELSTSSSGSDGDLRPRPASAGSRKGKESGRRRVLPASLTSSPTGAHLTRSPKRSSATSLVLPQSHSPLLVESVHGDVEDRPYEGDNDDTYDDDDEYDEDEDVGLYIRPKSVSDALRDSDARAPRQKVSPVPQH
ncbi:Lipase 5 [Sorochytrium milnesiophthora]